MKKPMYQRLIEGVKVNDNCCLIWQKGKTEEGYGRINIKGKAVLTHRLSYLLHRGEITPTYHIHHECETPACCNPDHLKELSPQDHGAITRCLEKARYHL